MVQGINDRVRLSREGYSTTIAIQLAHKKNALDFETADEISQAIKVAGDGDSRCIVLRSEGDVFCAGADLALLEILASKDSDTVRRLIYEKFQGLIRSIRHCPVPVICLLQGPALGVGADVALSCDAIVASEVAWMELTWSRLGLIPALGSAYELSGTVGRRHALEILLQPTRITAQRALAAGLVNRVAADEDLELELLEFTGIMTQHDRSTLVSTKALLLQASAPDRFNDHLEDAAKLQATLVSSPIFRANLSALQARVAGITAASDNSGVSPEDAP